MFLNIGSGPKLFLANLSLYDWGCDLANLFSLLAPLDLSILIRQVITGEVHNLA